MILSTLFLITTIKSVQVQIQQDDRQGYTVVKSGIGSCEINGGILTQLGFKASDQNELVIVIARIGIKEKPNRLNKKRLEAAQSKLARYMPKENIILAEGNPVSSEGRVEFYFKGKLYLISLVEKNKNLCTDF